MLEFWGADIWLGSRSDRKGDVIVGLEKHLSKLRLEGPSEWYY